MKNLYLLPTGRESKLFENVDNDIFAFSKEAIRWRGEQFLNHHIYIISDEIPTEGDALMRTDTSRVFCTLKGANPSIVQKYCRKIILTTDPLLEDVQQIEDKLLKWFVQNPKCEWVEVATDLNTQGKNGLDRARFIYKIIIPESETYICPKTNKQCDDECCVSAENCNIGTGVLSEPKQQTLEEAAKNYSIGWGQCDDKKAFIAGAKWQQERDYELIDRYVDDVTLNSKTG